MVSIAALVEIGIEHETNDDGRLARLRLPFTAEQWVDVLNRDGDLLPACCGTISAMRDLVMAAARDGGWVDAKELSELIDLMMSHDGFDEVVEDPDHEAIADHDPWARIARAWHAAKGHLAHAADFDIPRRADPNDLRDAVHLVSEHSMRLWLGDFFGGPQEYSAESYPTMSEEERERAAAKSVWRHRAMRARVLPTLVAAVSTLHRRLAEYDFGRLEGFAIVLTTRPQWVDQPDGSRSLEPNISTDDLGHGIVQVAGSLALYDTVEEAEQVRTLWSERRPDIREITEIRPFRATLAEGIRVQPRPDSA